MLRVLIFTVVALMSLVVLAGTGITQTNDEIHQYGDLTAVTAGALALPATSYELAGGCGISVEVTPASSGWINEWTVEVINEGAVAQAVTVSLGALAGTLNLDFFEIIGADFVNLDPAEARLITLKAYAVGCAGTYGREIVVSDGGSCVATAPVTLVQTDSNLIGTTSNARATEFQPENSSARVGSTCS